MKVISIVSSNENSSACTPCGGKCCKGIPGVFHPDDLFSNMSDLEIKNKMISMLETGDFVITDDEIPDNKSKYTVRVQAIAPRGGNRHSGWFAMGNWGTCSKLTDVGCSLSSEDRPRECRALIPSPLGQSKCKPEASFDRQDLLTEWVIYEDIVQEIWDMKAVKIAA